MQVATCYTSHARCIARNSLQLASEDSRMRCRAVRYELSRSDVWRAGARATDHRPKAGPQYIRLCPIDVRNGLNGFGKTGPRWTLL